MPIKPKTLSGFKDRLPKEAYAKSKILQNIAQSFEQFGFSPIETPHLEYQEMLSNQAGEEIQKEIYRFFDHGKRAIALRFDLTIPLARFAIQYKDKLCLPFKRYAIGNVFRGERAQKGRYREFTQCDFDYIGTTSPNSDAEIVNLIYHALHNLGLQDFTIQINNRKILNGLCLSIDAQQKATEILRSLDKLQKIGQEALKEELMQKASLSQMQIQKLFSFLDLSKHDTQTLLQTLQDYKNINSLFEEGIKELESLCHLLAHLIPKENFRIELSIARGLGYYTGIVYETTLNALPSLGSICSGGRYDHLTQNFSHEPMSGVGASIGIDRLLVGLEELGLLPHYLSNQLLLIPLSTALPAYKAAQELRKMGLNIEVYPEITKAKKAFSYADKKEYQWVGIIGQEEANTNTCSLKNLKNGEQQNLLSYQEIAHIIKAQNP